MHYRLVDGWEGLVIHKLQKVLPFIANGPVSGIMIGDELVGNGVTTESRRVM